MKHVNCRVKHNPPETYGDCLRCCVAAILEVDAEDVMHFFEHGQPIQMDQIRKFLIDNFKQSIFAYSPMVSHFKDVLNEASLHAPDTHFIVAGDGHAVVAKNNKVVMDPAWVPRHHRMDLSDEGWTVMFLVTP